jgi:ACS family hexuronate transporter-like MFS transporter
MISWRAAEGADVRRGDVIAAIEVGDANRVAVSRLDGRLTGKIARDGEMVAAGEPIGWVMVRPLGYSAFWLAIAGFMVGLLAAARLMPATWLGSGGWGQALGEVVRLRRFWVLAVVSISINVCWHFLVNWLPTYLLSDRGIDLKASLWLNALLFLAADAGNIGGGLASRKVAALGVEPGRARAIVVSACAVLIAGGAAVGLIENQAVVLVMLGVMAFGAAAFMANYFAFCQDVSPRRTGLVVGILGGLGNLFAAGFSPIAGGIKDATGGLAPVFWVVGLLPFLGVAVIWLGPARVVVAEPE